MIVAQTRNKRGNVVTAYGLSSGDLVEISQGSFVVAQGAGQAAIMCMETDRKKLKQIIQDFMDQLQDKILKEMEQMEERGDLPEQE